MLRRRFAPGSREPQSPTSTPPACLQSMSPVRPPVHRGPGLPTPLAVPRDHSAEIEQPADMATDTLGDRSTDIPAGLFRRLSPSQEFAESSWRYAGKAGLEYGIAQLHANRAPKRRRSRPASKGPAARQPPPPFAEIRG